MELIKENVIVNRILYKGSTQALVDEDIIVPDVKPDILKILQLDASSCAVDKEISDGKTRINGRVDLKILYIPDSDKEKIKSIVTSFDFTQNMDSPNAKEEAMAAVTMNVERAEFTLINSRKLRVKVIVGINYEIVEKKNVEIAVDAADSENAELLRENIRLQNCIGLSETEFLLKGSAEISGTQAAIGEILKTDTKISDSEYKTVTDKIVAKGTVVVCILYTDEDGKIQFVETELPFTEVFDCPDAGDETLCDIDYGISDVNYEISEDSDGEKRIVDLTVTVTAQIKATENISVDMISDCYEPFMKTQLLKEETEIEEVISRPSSCNTIRAVAEPASGAPGITGVYDVIAKPYISSAKLRGGKLLAEGKVETYILYLTDSDESPVYSMKKELPFSYLMECDSVDTNLIPEIKAEIKHTAYSLNVAGEIELRCILSLNANIIRKRKIEIIDDIAAEELEEGEKKGIVIYFVQKGDNLWEVSKRYAVPRDEVLKFNNMTENDKLEAGNRLFIPSV